MRMGFKAPHFAAFLKSRKSSQNNRDLSQRSGLIALKLSSRETFFFFFYISLQLKQKFTSGSGIRYIQGGIARFRNSGLISLSIIGYFLFFPHFFF